MKELPQSSWTVSLGQIFFGRFANLFRQRARARRQLGDPARGRFQFEPLESWILLSADLIGDVPQDAAPQDTPFAFNAPVNAAADSYRLRFNAGSGELELLDGATVVASQALTATTEVIINGEDGWDDSLTIDFAFGGFFSVSGGITFNGGADGFDALSVAGGEFTSVTYTLTTSGPGLSGSIVYEDGLNSAQTIGYTGLEPVDMTGSTIADLVFNLPGVDDQAILEDGGVAGDGVSRIRSQNATPTFDTTTFSNPTSSLTVNMGGDSGSFTVASLPDFTRSLTINGQAGADNVAFAGTTNLSSAGADLSITVTGSITDAAGASVTVSNNASITGFSITLADNVTDRLSVGADATFTAGGEAITIGLPGGNVTTFGTLTFNAAGEVSIFEDSDTVLTGNSAASSLLLVALGSITDAGTTSLAVTNNATLICGTSISLADNAADVLSVGGSARFSASNITVAPVGIVNLGELTFDTIDTTGAVSISEDSDTVLTGNNTAGSLSLVAAGSITDAAGTRLTVTNNATLVSGTSISLADNAADVLSVGGSARFSASNITVAPVGVVNLGVLTFNSAGAVIISEDSDTVLTGSNAASSLSMASAGSITDTAGDSIAVTGTASFTAGSAITLGDDAADSINFGVLTINAAGAIDLSEDSATVLTGIVSNNNDVNLSSAGTLAIAQALNAGTGDVRLVAGTTVVQVASGVVTADELGILAGGVVRLATGGNDVNTLAVGTTGLVEFSDVDDLAIGVVAAGGNAGFVGTVGIVSGNNDVNLRAAATAAGTLSINQAISAGTSDVRIRTVTATASVTQAAAGVISADELGVQAAGAVTLGAAENDVNTLAVASTGLTEFSDVDDLVIGVVAAGGGTGFAGAAGITSGNNDINLQTGTSLQINQALHLGTADVRLVAGTTVNQSAIGVVTADELGIRAGGAVTLAAAFNDVDTLAVASTGLSEFTDGDDLTIGSVAAGGNAGFTTTSGINTGGNNLNLTAGGGLTVTSSLDSGTGAMTLTAPGGVSFTASAVVNVDLGGTAANEFTSITISDAATLGGTLDVELVNFTPSSGDRFRFMSFDVRNGFFGATILPPEFVVDQSDAIDLELVFAPDNVAPTVMLNQAVAQPDPTNASPILFTVEFSEPIVGFTGSDVSFVGSTVGGTLVANVSGSGASYTVSVTGMDGVGTVVASIVAGAATDVAGNLSFASTSIDNTVTFDNVSPTVTLNQAPGQPEPTNAVPILFSVLFSEAITGFTAEDISFVGSTVGGTLAASVMGSGASYTVAVTGMDGVGTVVVSVVANSATDLAGNLSFASTSIDNTVTFDNVSPTVTIDQAAGQGDPSIASPILFTVVFSEAIVGFTAEDISFAGSTVGGTLAAAVTGSGAIYTVAVTGMNGAGTVVTSVVAAAATDLAGNLSFASTSTDNTVTHVPAPDLVGTVQRDPGDLLIPGGHVHVTVVVSNVGDAAAQNSVKVKLYASADDVLDASDILLDESQNSGRIDPGDSKSFQLNFRFPGELPPGEYRLLAVVDADNNVAESNEANNVALGEAFEFPNALTVFHIDAAGNGVWTTLASGPAYATTDLFTVVMHELGYESGWTVMQDTLPLGKRYTIDWNARADAGFLSPFMVKRPTGAEFREFLRIA